MQWQIVAVVLLLLLFLLLLVLERNLCTIWNIRKEIEGKVERRRE